MTQPAPVAAGDFTYIGDDLESMDTAVNYHGWILSHFRPHLGHVVAEVGAGTGSFSAMLAECAGVTRLLAIEPSVEMANRLHHSADAMRVGVEVQTYTGFLDDVRDQIESAEVDTFVYVNVFEHIERDERELQLLFDLLLPGGKVCIFVPALMWLYSEFDRSIDHYRRYTRHELEQKARTAGFEIVESRYFDVLGILPWLVKFRIFKSKKIDHRSVAIYDRLAVPVMRRIERLLRPPVGKNVMLVARKPTTAR